MIDPFDIWNKSRAVADGLVRLSQLQQCQAARGTLDEDTLKRVQRDAGTVAVISVGDRALVLSFKKPLWVATSVAEAWCPYLRLLDVTDMLTRNQLYVASVREDGRLVFSWCGEGQQP